VNLKETMRTLKEMGTAQNVKVYRRHGAGNKLYGVSFANLGKLKRQIKVDHKLAEQLWKSGNTDAMSLAAMIAEPAAFTTSSADRWAKDVRYYLLADLLGGLIAKSDIALGRYAKWSRSKNEYTKQCGYVVFCSLLKRDPDLVPDEVCEQTLTTIEEGIHTAPNRARHAMNSALISIGIYRHEFRQLAITAAKRIGKVKVDHGETSCTTPDAIAYIRKATAHAQTKKKRRSAKATRNR
jgi:3-methyladenine DNA glycosylase AlkD